jgi:hypothetical protein
VIEGRVERGGLFEAGFASGLVFRLDPETSRLNPPGWTIRVTPTADTASDYAMVVTPPFRFGNARYVNTAYGVSAENALSMTPRDFQFVADDRNYQVARRALDVLLWPGTHTEAEVAEAEAAMKAVQTFDGRLWIEEGEARVPDSNNPQGVIEWLRFRAELCISQSRPGA